MKQSIENRKKDNILTFNLKAKVIWQVSVFAVTRDIPYVSLPTPMIFTIQLKYIMKYNIYHITWKIDVPLPKTRTVHPNLSQVWNWINSENVLIFVSLFSVYVFHFFTKPLMIQYKYILCVYFLSWLPNMAQLYVQSVWIRKQNTFISIINKTQQKHIKLIGLRYSIYGNDCFKSV